jgi:DNA-binding transcriptional MerR regulator
MDKSADAFRTISETAEELDLPQHVLRFWETRFPQIKPLKRAGGRRYYRPRDIEILRLIRRLLYGEGYTIKGVQRVLKERGAGALTAMQDAAAGRSPDLSLPPERISDDLEGAPPLQFDYAGVETDHRVSPDSPESEDLANSAGNTHHWHKGALVLAMDDVARLQVALAELVECEEILEGAHRA